VSTINQQLCRGHLPIVITSSSGYLSSAITMVTGQGGRECPWRIQLPVGQRMNVTLISFFSATGAWYDSVQASSAGQAGRSVSMTTSTTTTRPNACYQLAVFREGMDSTEVTRTVTECEGGPRKSHVYLSESNTIDIEILVSRSQNDRKLYFLLHYTGWSTLSFWWTIYVVITLQHSANESNTAMNPHQFPSKCFTKSTNLCTVADEFVVLVSELYVYNVASVCGSKVDMCRGFGGLTHAHTHTHTHIHM
jgi:hypothetical protein